MTGTVTDPPQLLDRVTPDAVLLLPPGADYDDPAVRAVRRKGIHGSDVAAIVGATKRGSARSVWHEKHDGVFVDLPHLATAAKWGRLLEPVVAAEWAERHDMRPGRLLDVGTVVNVDQPWMRAQVDRLLHWCPDWPVRPCTDPCEGCGGPSRPEPCGGCCCCIEAQGFTAGPVCALEVKCRSAWVASKWRDDIPDDVLAQVAWQRMVTGLDHVHVVCLIDGNRPVDFRYDRDERLEQLLATECGALWDRVLSHDPPDLVYDEVIRDLLAQLFPDRAGERELTPTEYGELVAAWQLMREAGATAAELKQIARGKVLEKLGDAEVLTFGGTPVWSYRAVAPVEVAAHTRAGYRALNGPR